MSRYADLPYIQAANHGGTRTGTQMIVIHATANDASAKDEASYASRRAEAVSAHFYTDEVETYQTLDTVTVAFGCYPTGNARSVQFELCGYPGSISDATMRQAAPIVARAAAEFAIPIVKISPEELRNGTRGICGHRDVTQAWHEGDHIDPEPFPWTTFLGYVQAAASATKVGSMNGTLIPGHPVCVPVPVVGGKRRWLSVGADLGGAHLRIAFMRPGNKWSVKEGIWVANDADPWTPELPSDVVKISMLVEDPDTTAAIGWTVIYV